MGSFKFPCFECDLVTFDWWQIELGMINAQILIPENRISKIYEQLRNHFDCLFIQDF